MSEIRHEPRAPTQVQARAGGEVIDRHRHDDHQLIYLSTGVLAVRTEAGAWVAACDRAIWIPAGTWHEHRFYGASSFHTVGFGVADAPLADDSPVIVAVSALLRELLIACTDSGLPAAEARRIRAVVRDQLRRARVQPVSLPAARDARLAEACDLVLRDLARPRTLGWLARAVGTSERTLARLYRAEFGMTYPQWRTNVRVFHAMIQLAGGATVTEAGRCCGWATTSAFIDTFRHAMGQTPGAYQNAMGGSPGGGVPNGGGRGAAGTDESVPAVPSDPQTLWQQEGQGRWQTESCRSRGGSRCLRSGCSRCSPTPRTTR